MTAPSNLHWSHVALNCRDQRTTEAFYHRWFGFERARSIPIDNQQEIVFLRQGSIYLELFATPQGPLAPPATADGPQAPGVARHLAFQCESLDEFLDRIGDQIPVSLGPLHFDEIIPGWRSVWLTDPDGVVVEVSQGYVDDVALAR